MSSSSVTQSDLGYFDEGPNTVQVSASAAPFQADQSGTVSLPSFGPYGEAYALTARIAGRINAANVSDAEFKILLRERQSLLDKKFGTTITRKEENRLAYVRWTLDRIEDARYGQTIDELENLTRKYEQFRTDIKTLSQQLEQATKKSR